MNPLDLHDWLPRSNAVNLLAGVFLLASLRAAGTRRVRASIAAYRLNSVALGLIALVVALETRSWAVAVAASMALVVKAGIIPLLLARQVRSEHVQSRVGFAPGMLACGALVVVAFSQTRALFGEQSQSLLAACLPVSVATLLVGLFLMVTRPQALQQVVGLVVVENAIFLAAVSLTHGLPLVVEMGILLDVLAGAALLGLFVGRIHEATGEDKAPPTAPGDAA